MAKTLRLGGHEFSMMQWYTISMRVDFRAPHGDHLHGSLTLGPVFIRSFHAGTRAIEFSDEHSYHTYRLEEREGTVLFDGAIGEVPIAHIESVREGFPPVLGSLTEYSKPAKFRYNQTNCASRLPGRLFALTGVLHDQGGYRRLRPVQNGNIPLCG